MLGPSVNRAVDSLKDERQLNPKGQRYACVSECVCVCVLERWLDQTKTGQVPVWTCSLTGDALFFLASSPIAFLLFVFPFSPLSYKAQAFDWARVSGTRGRFKRPLGLQDEQARIWDALYFLLYWDVCHFVSPLISVRWLSDSGKRLTLRSRLHIPAFISSVNALCLF